MSSESDDENVIRYGTPLEPYEEDEIPSKRKFQQQPDQYAVDGHGRRRFHGAFTGGFSAGFGNTVGSQEGWTPSTFKSSRSEKAQFSGHKAEDFMDEEDRSEFGIAPRHMQTQNEFSGRKRPQQNRFHDGPIPGEPVLETLVRAVHETAAVRMLRAMGWREGQGVGGRVTREEKKRARQQHKVYGCYMPEDVRQTIQNENEDSTDSEFEYDTLFAPDDYEPYLLVQKNDRFGLGYSGLSRHSVLGNMTGEYGEGSSKSHLVMKDKGKRVSIRGQAFGVGAFEAEDEDIYATEDMSHYDFTLGGASNDQKKQTKKPAGGSIIAGFVKSSAPMPSVPSYPPPALPRDYVPARAGAARSRFEPSNDRPRDQGLGRHDLTAAARGNLLGETPIPRPKTPDSTPNQITTQPQTTPKEDPIEKLLGRNVNFVNEDYISIKDTGKELVKVFKPFVGDPKKQARYEKYCKDKSVAFEGDGDRLSEWERDRELMEFEQAAKLYRPLTGDMGDRFTHASQPDEALNPLTAVAKSSTNYGIASKDQMDAAARGVYGVMTRKQDVWRPEALVCKRFNVPQPYLDRPESAKEEKPKISYSIFSYLESSVHDKESFTKEQSKFSGSKSITHDKNLPSHSRNIENNESTVKNNKDTAPKERESAEFKRMTVAELFMKESEKDKNEGAVTETIDKFDKMDLYKAIFQSDSEDDAAEGDEKEKANDFVDVPKNVERNNSPPRGIFANIDFDELNSWRTNNKDENKTQNDKVDKQIETAVKITDKELNEADLYGPKIPENLKVRLEPNKDDVAFKPVFRKREERGKETEVVEVESSSSDSWVEAKEVKTKKHKKKSKKHKSKHKKSKHKKRDK